MLRRYACCLDIIIRLNLSLFFSKFELHHSLGILAMKVTCMRNCSLPIHFHANSFKTLRVLWMWSEDMRVVGI